MSLRPLLTLVTAALLGAPAAVFATPVFVTILIPEIIFEGLGNCIPPFTALPPDTSGNCTTDPGYPGGPPGPPVQVNDIPGDWGFGKKYDQLRIRAASFSGVVELDDPQTLSQTFDFAVGDTGGGSAGPYPGPYPTSIGGVAYGITLDREIIVNGTPGTLEQGGTLKIDWWADTLRILAATYVFKIGNETLTVNLDEILLDPIEGDPTFTMTGSFLLSQPTAVPIPSTLALLGLGLFGLAARRRRQHA